MQMGTWDLDTEDLARAGYMLDSLTTEVDAIIERNEDDIANNAERRAVAGEIVDHVCRRLSGVEPPTVEDDE